MTQLALFEPQTTAVMRDARDLMWERALSQEVEIALIELAAARPDDWLGWSDFHAVMNEYQIGSCMGHVLGRIARAGLLREQKVFLGKGIGAETPGSGNYQGYTHKWRAA